MEGKGLSISVHEAIQLPVMDSAQLLAGFEGIHNQIKWVTIVEVIEDINRFQEGEFLITTGYGLNKDSLHFQRLLAMNKLSGVAIYSGFYLKEIPQIFMDIANENNLPLIELPTDINFSTVTKSILQQILNKQMEMTSFSLETHKQLTNLVLKNDEENKITNTLSRLIDSSIFVLNEYDEFTYHILRHDSLTFSNDEILHEELSLPFLDFAEKCRLKRRPFEAEWGQFNVHFHPIIANDKYFGCLIVLTGKEEWKEIYLTTIEHAATVYAIESLKEEAVKQTQIRLRGEFLEEIINKNFQSSSIILDRGKNLGYNLSLNQAVLQIKLEDYKGSEIFKQHMELLYNHSLRIMDRKKRQFIIRTRLDGLIILTEVCKEKKKSFKQDSLDIARDILFKWKERHPEIPIIIGVGKTYSNINQLSESANEAKYAVELSGLLLEKKELVHYEDLATFHLLFQMREMGISLKQFYEELIGPLLPSNRQGIDYIQTLDVYFKNNLNLQTTAANLFIHRHTLKYRLNKIESLSGFNLTSADERLKLQLAIAAYKLEEFYRT